MGTKNLAQMWEEGILMTFAYPPPVPRTTPRIEKANADVQSSSVLQTILQDELHMKQCAVECTCCRCKLPSFMRTSIHDCEG